MKRSKKYYEIMGRLDERKALPEPVDGFIDVDALARYVFGFMELQRLAKKHHKLAEMDCNGEGVIRGVHYYNGTIDDYAKRTYGYGVKSAYLKDETTVFDVESEKVQDKIKKLAQDLRLDVEFQGDPRGATVKIKVRNTSIGLTDILYA